VNEEHGAKECLETVMLVDAELNAKNKNVQEEHRQD
jgi:hypothetical protein